MKTYLLYFAITTIGLTGICSSCNLNLTKTGTAKTEEESVQLLDTTGWTTHSLDQVKEGLTFKLPDSLKIYSHSEGVTIFIEGDIVIHSFQLENEYQNLDMAEQRKMLEDSDDRKDLKWLIDEENMAYYTGLDLSVKEGFQTTHSGYAKKKIGDLSFYTNIDGITLSDGIHQMNQKTLLMLLTSFNTISLEN